MKAVLSIIVEIKVYSNNRSSKICISFVRYFIVDNIV